MYLSLADTMKTKSLTTTLLVGLLDRLILINIASMFIFFHINMVLASLLCHCSYIINIISLYVFQIIKDLARLLFACERQAVTMVHLPLSLCGRYR